MFRMRAAVVLGSVLLLAACEDLPGAGPLTDAYVVVQDGVVVDVRPVPVMPALPVTEPTQRAQGTGCPSTAGVLYGGSRYCLRGGV